MKIRIKKPLDFSDRFVWAESHEAVDYANWADGQPEDNDCCCVFKAITVATGWHDAPCDWTYWPSPGEQIHAICEKELE